MNPFSTRRTRLPLVATGAFVAIALAAIAQTKQPSRIVQIGEFHAQVHVSLHVGDTLRVVLPSTPSTGYSWQAAGTPLLKTIGSTNASAAEHTVGAPARQTLAFTAEAPGSRDLVLDYSRPWENGKPAARQYMLQVTVDDGAKDSTASPVVIEGSTPIGTYSGKLPCADCSGLLTSIAFYAEGSAQSPAGYYVRTSTYLGAPKGDAVFIEAGHYLLQKGTPAKPGWTVYTLQSNTSDRLESYRLEGDALVPLDSDGKTIQSPFNMRLKLQS